MLDLAGYTIRKQLEASASSQIYLGTCNQQGLRVVCKLYPGDRGASGVSRAAHEFAVLRRVEGPGVVRALALDTIDGSDVLVLEAFDGVPLSELRRRRGTLDAAAFLKLALQLAESLQRIHEARIVHRDLKPDNVLVHPETLETCIIDFGISSELGRTQSLARQHQPEGTLRYIAPEQTGRIDKGIDFRTDLYLLGGALYEVLTGQPPFLETNPVALINAHLAARPEAPSVLVPEVSATLSRIVMRLLEKEPESRYQSAYGLVYDLRRCRQALESSGAIPEDVVLGERDACDRLRFGQKLYGRDPEIRRLSQAFERVASGGCELMLLTGPTGSGKSALPGVLRQALLGTHGYLARGKFDWTGQAAEEGEGQRVPYAGVASVIASLMDQILAESPARFAAWAARLRESLGSIGAVLVDLVPELGVVVEDFPPVPAIAAHAARQRLALAFARLVRAFASPAAPLVLVFDDLQWSDSGSLLVLEHLLTSSDLSYLLVVATHRGAEASMAGELRERLARIENVRNVSMLEIRPLSVGAANEMIADVLQRSCDETLPLAELIALKTSNMPLEIRQTLETLWERGMLEYHHGEGWCWNAEQVSQLELTDDAVGLMERLLDVLPQTTRDVLTLASLLAAEVDLDTLHLIHSGERRLLLRELTDLVDRGLLVASRKGFRFAHDRIREAARARVGAPQRKRMHYDIGLILWERHRHDPASVSAFEVASQLNRGVEHVTEERKLDFVRLCHEAADQLLRSGAAAQALELFLSGCQAFRESDWESERDLGFALFLSASEAMFRESRFEQALDFLDVLDARDPSPAEFARIAVKRIQVWALKHPPEEAARRILRVLETLGVRWPERPSALRAMWSLWKLRFVYLRSRKGPALRPLSPDAQPPWLPALEVISAGGATFARKDAYLGILASCFVLSAYARDGIPSSPAYSLAAVASWESLPHIGIVDRARDWVRLAMEWQARIDDPIFGPRAEYVISTMVSPFLMRRRDALAPLTQISERLREVGEIEFALYGGFQDIYGRALAGDSIAGIYERLRGLVEYAERIKSTYGSPIHCLRVYSLLTVPPEDRSELVRLMRAESAELERSLGSASGYVRSLWMMVLCIYAEHQLVYAESDEICAVLHRMQPHVHMAHMFLYRGIAAAALARASRGKERRRYLRALGKSLAAIRRWARSGPDLVHMSVLLEAEILGVRGWLKQAEKSYARAARLAEQQQFPHHVALAHECHARLLTLHRHDSAATIPLRRAIDAYSRWGARAKVRGLEGELTRWAPRQG